MTLDRGTKLGTYEIEESIGAGGMGEVYRARDHKLDRDVAIKVLPEALATEDFLLRFEREAKAVAALSHPNILAIYDFGREGGVSYAVMELLEGETLRARIEKGRLLPRKVMELGVQCCSGLAAAHDKAIVHRDLKPENLFVTREGHLKILDFGLAKVGSPVDGTPGTEEAQTKTRNTSAGTVLGTIGYMAPEQVRGLSSDHRSDIFSLGAILYEALSGSRAFQGVSAADTMSAILKDEPRELSSAVTDIPVALERIVRRCLEKGPAERFQSARDLRFALETISDVKRESSQVPAGTDGVEASASIAVLPFTDMSAQKDHEYFCEGMAEEILNALSKVRGLRVAARSSAFQFGTKAHDVRHVGKTLGVRQVLEGSVRTAGRRLRVSAQLVNVADGYQIWSERYEGDAEDVFAIQDEISAKIVAALHGQIGVEKDIEPARRATENVAAYHLYLRGRHAFERRYRGGPQSALPFFEEAVKEDPSYGLAHAGIGDCYSILGLYGFLPPKEAHEKATAAIARALAIDEGIAEAHTTLGRFRLLFDHAWGEAEKEFQRALQLNPSDIQAYCWYGLCLATLGRSDEAVAQVEKARKLDPLSPYVSMVLMFVLTFGNRNEEAIREGERTLELDPDFAIGFYVLGSTLTRVGRYDRAVELLEKAAAVTGRASFYLGFLGWAYGRAGRENDARGVLSELEERAKETYVAPTFFVCIHAGLGEDDRVFHYLELARESGSPLGIWTKFPIFDTVRSDPRFKRMTASIGLRDA